MQLVQMKATTSKRKLILTYFKERKNVVEMEEIPGELILNLDQTGINLVPSSTCGQWKKKVNIEYKWSLLTTTTSFFAAVQ